MATHSSVLAWRIPGTEEPGGLPSLRLHRVEHATKQLSSSTTTTRQGKNCYAQVDKTIKENLRENHESKFLFEDLR